MPSDEQKVESEGEKGRELGPMTPQTSFKGGAAIPYSVPIHTCNDCDLQYKQTFSQSQRTSP